ncbi:hypothetical protein IW150_004833, partial [Coemansia sp. RSA 2607]
MSVPHYTFDTDAGGKPQLSDIVAQEKSATIALDALVRSEQLMRALSGDSADFSNGLTLLLPTNDAFERLDSIPDDLDLVMKKHFIPRAITPQEMEEGVTVYSYERLATLRFTSVQGKVFVQADKGAPTEVRGLGVQAGSGTYFLVDRLVGTSMTRSFRKTAGSLGSQRGFASVFSYPTSTKSTSSRHLGQRDRLLEPAASGSTSPVSSGVVCMGGSKAGYASSKIRQFSTRSYVDGWGSYSSVFSKISDRKDTKPSGDAYNYSIQRRIALLKDAAESQIGNPDAQNDYYRELLKPEMNGSRTSLVISRIEQGRAAADLTTLQLYLSALMQSKVSPDRAALRLIEVLKNQPELVKKLVGTNGTSGYDKILHMLADSNGLSGMSHNKNSSGSGSSKGNHDNNADLFYDEDVDTHSGKKGGDQKDGSVDKPIHVILQEKGGS